MQKQWAWISVGYEKMSKNEPTTDIKTINSNITIYGQDLSFVVNYYTRPTQYQNYKKRSPTKTHYSKHIEAINNSLQYHCFLSSLAIFQLVLNCILY